MHTHTYACNTVCCWLHSCIMHPCKSEYEPRLRLRYTHGVWGGATVNTAHGRMTLDSWDAINMNPITPDFPIGAWAGCIGSAACQRASLLLSLSLSLCLSHSLSLVILNKTPTPWPRVGFRLLWLVVYLLHPGNPLPASRLANKE